MASEPQSAQSESPHEARAVNRAKVEPIWSVRHRVGADRLRAVACAYCDGDGDACNPGNADPGVKVTDWLYPVVCPRCGGTGKDPNP